MIAPHQNNQNNQNNSTTVLNEIPGQGCYLDSIYPKDSRPRRYIRPESTQDKILANSLMILDNNITNKTDSVATQQDALKKTTPNSASHTQIVGDIKHTENVIETWRKEYETIEKLKKSISKIDSNINSAVWSISREVKLDNPQEKNIKEHTDEILKNLQEEKITRMSVLDSMYNSKSPLLKHAIGTYTQLTLKSEIDRNYNDDIVQLIQVDPKIIEYIRKKHDAYVKREKFEETHAKFIIIQERTERVKQLESSMLLPALKELELLQPNITSEDERNKIIEILKEIEPKILLDYPEFKTYIENHASRANLTYKMGDIISTIEKFFPYYDKLNITKLVTSNIDNPESVSCTQATILSQYPQKKLKLQTSDIFEILDTNVKINLSNLNEAHKNTIEIVLEAKELLKDSSSNNDQWVIKLKTADEASKLIGLFNRCLDKEMPNPGISSVDKTVEMKK